MRYEMLKEPVKITVWFQETGNGFIRSLTDSEAESLMKTGDKTVQQEFSLWQEPSWGTQELIRENARRFLPDGRVGFDLQRYNAAQIMYLLKGWSLGEKEPSLKLQTVVPPGVDPKDGITVLSDASMGAVRRVRREIVDAFLTKAQERVYAAENTTVVPPVAPPVEAPKTGA